MHDDLAVFGNRLEGRIQFGSSFKTGRGHHMQPLEMFCARNVTTTIRTRRNFLTTKLERVPRIQNQHFARLEFAHETLGDLIGGGEQFGFGMNFEISRRKTFGLTRDGQSSREPR